MVDSMYEILPNRIHFANGQIQTFPQEIAEVLDFDDAIVIRLISGLPEPSQNIFAFNLQGKLLWNMPTPLSFSAYNPYVALFRKGGFVDVLSWDGHLVTLHPNKGFILGESYYMGYGSGSRRSPAPRQWI